MNIDWIALFLMAFGYYGFYRLGYMRGQCSELNKLTVEYEILNALRKEIENANHD